MPKPKDGGNSKAAAVNRNQQNNSNGTVKANGNHHSVPSSNSSSTATSMSTVNKKQSARDKERLQQEREKIVIWRRPFQTVKYCFLECCHLLQYYGKQMLAHKILLSFAVVLIGVMAAAYHIQGAHQPYVELIRRNLWFITYWVGLGVLSSVGLGTGLHTFLLYLGPHIASVTLAAYECNSLDFPAPPYPDDIICPERVDPKFVPSLWNIMSKVRFEAFLWGAGTALGELPPYFMARAARLSGRDPDDGDDLENIAELKRKSAAGEKLSLLERGKLFMETMVERVGFLGILACASIPNPLFDLAGITCGHFLVPFWTFFGATLIGKAVIKMHIQKVFVVIAFNEALIEKAIDMLRNIPLVGKPLQEPFKTFLQNQKSHLHSRKGGAASSAPGGGNLLARVFEKFVILMVAYFVVSIVNSLAQSYHSRLHKNKAAASSATTGAKIAARAKKLARD